MERTGPTPQELFDEFRRRHPDRLRDVAPSDIPGLFQARRRIILRLQGIYLAAVLGCCVLRAVGRWDDIDLFMAGFALVAASTLTFIAYACPRCGTSPDHSGSSDDSGVDLNPTRCRECGAALREGLRSPGLG